MSLRNIDIQVFRLDDDAFEAIGGINHFTSLIWPNKFDGYATFELNAPVTPENTFLLKEGNVIWCGGDNAAVIEILQSSTNENGEKVLKVKGRTLEQILTTRIIWGTYHCTSKYISTAMYEIVNEQCVNPSDSYRKIPYLECAEDEFLGKIVTFQKTGGEVYDALVSVTEDSNLGFDVLFRPREKKLIFKVTEGIDRTVMQQNDNGSKLVIFSTELEDILSSSYYKNGQDMKTLAYVAGEGSGTERKHIISGNAATKGFLRRELYVDARDLQSEVSNSDGTTTTINEEDYRDLLNDRGMEKLAACAVTETFEAKMRVVGNNQYTYGVDYFKGDQVIVRDEELGVQVTAKITEVSENFDDEYELEITFGYSYPTLLEKIKQRTTY